jgi:hypothetical protein
LVLNVLKAFKQLEAAEVDPSLLPYPIILNKDGDKAIKNAYYFGGANTTGKGLLDFLDKHKNAEIICIR